MYNYCPKCGKKYRNIDGNDVFRCSSCHFTFYNNPKPVALAFIVHPQNGNLLLARRAVEPFKNYWGLPGGFISFGEEPTTALQREVLEEINVACTVASLLTAYHEFYYNEGNEKECYSVVVMVYDVSLEFYENFQPADDVAEVKFFSKDKLPRNIAFTKLEKCVHYLLDKYELSSTNYFRNRGIKT